MIDLRVPLLAVLLCLLPAASIAQVPAPSPDAPLPAIATETSPDSDRAIAARIRGVFRQIESLRDVEVEVAQGVVSLGGKVPTIEDVNRSESIAQRVEGVVTADNYVSSLVLSLRQPFRAGDHAVIASHEGRVARMTSRATILVTLDGNHLRIPNSIVFKAVILHYTRNPERRFEFDLGIDANDDPVEVTRTSS